MYEKCITFLLYLLIKVNRYAMINLLVDRSQRRIKDLLPTLKDRQRLNYFLKWPQTIFEKRFTIVEV